MVKVLVTGGCGYIGSHTIIDLIEKGFEVVSIDNFSNSDPEVLDGIKQITSQEVQNYNIDLLNYGDIKKVFETERPEAIIHFAAYKSVGDSVLQPILYYENNIMGLVNIIKASREFGVRSLVFSSSCSVYGNSSQLPVDETCPISEAESPYARTKQIGEDIIIDNAKVQTDLNNIILRYFNPAGAHPSAIIGESPRNIANNLVPVITETAIGKRESMQVFGSDYDTRDGTCIRDYIHIMDLANAHTKCLEYLVGKKNQENCEIYNVGIGNGVSVKEAIHAFEKVSGRKLNYSIGPRRPGDVIAIYADYKKANSQLGWSPEFGIEDIMASAWKWELARSKTI